MTGDGDSSAAGAGGTGEVGDAGLAARAATAAHVVVDDLSAPVLSGEDAHHLRTVLRLRAGEPVGLTDGRGGYLAGVWTGAGLVEPAGPLVFHGRPTPAVTVGFVPVKGDRPEWTVQKLTEVGVDRILVLRAERSVVRWDGPRATTQIDRLAKVARAAVGQSRQLWLPEVVGVVGLAGLTGEAALADIGGRSGEPILADIGGRAGEAALADIGGPPLDGSVTAVLVGPEGGWSDGERAAWASAGGRLVGLGPTVLRAETAALVAGVLMTAHRGAARRGSPPAPP